MFLRWNEEVVARLDTFGWSSDDPAILLFLNYIACPHSVADWTEDARGLLIHRAAKKLGPEWTVTPSDE